MDVRAVIFRPDRTNDVILIRRKHLKGKSFRHNGNMYFLHSDRFQVTEERLARRLWHLKYYATYYYIQGISNPVPVPDFQGYSVPPRPGDIPTDISEEERKLMKFGGFKNVVDLGVPAEELAAIFNPWFYKTIANQEISQTEKIALGLLLLIVFGVGFLIFNYFSGA